MRTEAIPRPPKGARGAGGTATRKGEIGEGALAVAPPTALIDEGAFDAGGVADTGG